MLVHVTDVIIQFIYVSACVVLSFSLSRSGDFVSDYVANRARVPLLIVTKERPRRKGRVKMSKESSRNLDRETNLIIVGAISNVPPTRYTTRDRQIYEPSAMRRRVYRRFPRFPRTRPVD